ncbi:MAG: permease-like cell division protein FtsX [Rikenellaceae bacterium]|nr:permease-like cell division protein FtsX [Rikenellaceae bacterium]
MKLTDKQLRRRVRRSYAVSTISISMVLFLLGAAAYLMGSALRATDSIRENMAINLMLNSTTPEEQDSLGVLLRQTPEVKRVKFIDKAKAAEDFKEYVGEDFEEFLGSNPLPDSFEITLKAESSSSETADSLAEVWGAWEQTMEVVYPKSTMQLIEENLTRFNVVLVMMAAALLIIALILLRNTIRMTINTRIQLIETMKLVGATRWFIMRPFLGRSAVNGLYAGVLASLLLCAMVAAMSRGVPEMSFLVDDIALAAVCGGMIVMGVVISEIFTAAAVRRATRLQGGELYIY